MHLQLIDLDAIMNVIWHSGGYHLKDKIDYSAYFKSVYQAVKKNIARVSPTHLAVLIEDPSENVKRSRDQSYRSDRFILPLAGAIKVRRLISDLQKEKIKVIVCPKSEPYDVMAYLSGRLGAEHKITLTSSDRRIWGLVSENITVSWPYSRNPVLTMVTPKVLEETQHGLTPSQYREMLVLQGIHGIGVKKASKLIRDYGSLEEIGKHLPEIEGSLGEILRQNLKTEGVRAYRAVYPSKISQLGVKLSEIQMAS